MLEFKKCEILYGRSLSQHRFVSLFKIFYTINQNLFNSVLTTVQCTAEGNIK